MKRLFRESLRHKPDLLTCDVVLNLTKKIEEASQEPYCTGGSGAFIESEHQHKTAAKAVKQTPEEQCRSLSSSGVASNIEYPIIAATPSSAIQNDDKSIGKSVASILPSVAPEDLLTSDMLEELGRDFESVSDKNATTADAVAGKPSTVVNNGARDDGDDFDGDFVEVRGR